MIFYLTQFSIVGLFAYLHSYHKHEKISETAKWFCLLTLFIPSALRYGIGTDYVNYNAIFNRIMSRGFSGHTEIAWQVLNIIIGKLKLPFQGVIIISSALTLIPLIKTAKKDFFIIIVLFSCLYYLNSYNITRQILAMSLIWAAYLFILEKKYIHTFLLIILATLFHTSSLLFIPIFLFSEFIPLTKKRTIVLFIIFVVSFIFASNYIIPYIMKLKYSGENFIYYSEVIISLSKIFKAIPRFIVLFLILYFIDENKAEKREINYIYWLILSLAISDISGMSYLIFQRIRIYCFIAYLASFKILWLNTEKKEKIVNLFLLAFIIANYLVRFLWVGSAEVIPYTSIFTK